MNDSRVNVVAIDGPAGSGKSTVAKKVSEALAFIHVDTGAMYRAMTLKVLKAGVPIDDAARVARITSSAKIDFEDARVFLDDEDVTDEIRSGKVTKYVAKISGYPEVRATLLALQRRHAGSGSGIVMEGRDIGTVVFPDARWKFFLDASPEVRAGRRQAELVAQGRVKELQWVLSDLLERDKLDRERPVAPLKAAEDARVIDTTAMNVDDVVGRIVVLVRGIK